MGQAKKRGSQGQRIAEARARERAKFPSTGECNECQAQLSDIEPMDVRAVFSMRLAGRATCNSCGGTTWALDGTQEGLEIFTSFLTEGRSDVFFGVAENRP